jgi:4-methyl-5(b-hydroxyethyl)-thiazole monophosphate biosynthesis
MTGAEYTAELFTVDGSIITGEGPAATLPYAYKILSFFVGERASREMQVKMQYAHLMEK